MFSYATCEIFKNTYFEEYLQMTASEEISEALLDSVDKKYICYMLALSENNSPYNIKTLGNHDQQINYRQS